MRSWLAIFDPVGALERCRAAVAAVLAAQPKPCPRCSPLGESPAVVLVMALVVAIAAIPLVDAVAFSMSSLIAPEWRPSLQRVTALGEGWEILVGSGLVVIGFLAIDSRRLPAPTRAALQRLAALSAFAFASVASSGLMAALIKNAIGRARPHAIDGDAVLQFHAFAFQPRYAAFPSGHSTTAGATAMVLALMFPRWRWPILIAGLLVAVTRTLLEAHFPSDVVAGVGLGMAGTLLLAHLLARRGFVFRYDWEGRLVPAPGESFRSLAALFSRPQVG